MQSGTRRTRGVCGTAFRKCNFKIEQLKDKIENKMHEYHIKLIELSRESQTKLDDLDNERIKMEKKAFTAENEVERLLKECTEWTRYKEKQTQIELKTRT